MYCKTGVRSQIASEILANNSSTRVYNMVGGIFAWINAGYQIYTTYHYATVSVAEGEVLTHIEPLLLKQTCPAPCTQNQTCSSGNKGGVITNLQFAVLEQDENHTVARVSYEVNGSTFEFTFANTVLWSYNDVRDGYNRTARFTSMVMTGKNSSTLFYSLGYLVQCAEYNLSIQTLLTTLNSEAYNSSYTSMNYAPANKTGVVSLELVTFNTSVTLSSQYAILDDVARKIGELYRKSGDKDLAQLAPRYTTMGEEVKYLSKLAKGQLHEITRGRRHPYRVTLLVAVGYVTGMTTAYLIQYYSNPSLVETLGYLVFLQFLLISFLAITFGFKLSKLERKLEKRTTKK